MHHTNILVTTVTHGGTKETTVARVVTYWTGFQVQVLERTVLLLCFLNCAVMVAICCRVPTLWKHVQGKHETLNGYYGIPHRCIAQ